MKIVRRLMPLWVVGFLAGCATTRNEAVVIQAMDNGPAGLPPSSATASFRLPAGWSSTATDSKSQVAGRFSLCPRNMAHISRRPSMELLFGYLDSTVPYTQEGQARGYLEAIHHHSDDKVQIAHLGVVEHPAY